MQKETMLAMFAIIAVAALLGAITVETLSLPQLHQANAAGCTNSQAFNASKGRCFGH
jgi:hypothetical protein